ncbi:hypothetical protein ACC807_14955 [Rhizobium ruizarguesonis]
MNLVAVGTTLSNLLPKLRTRIQLSGLLIIVVVGAFVALAKPGDYIALALVGGVGVGFVVFGQLFHFLTAFDAGSRPAVFLISFIAFLLFIIALLVLLIVRVQAAPEPSIDITPVQSISTNSLSSKVENAFFAKTSDRSIIVPAILTSTDPKPLRLVSASDIEIGQTVRLPAWKPVGDATYTFSQPGGISTLTGGFPYTDWSRGDEFPDADFHDGVSWGTPHVWFNISNPTTSPLVFTLLQVDIQEFHLINEVIIDIPEIDGYVSGQKHEIELINRGWGKANDATLRLWVGNGTPTGDTTTYNILAEKIYQVGLLDEKAVVDIGDLVPLDAKWDDSTPNESHCNGRQDGSLVAIGRLDYINDVGTPQHETFRTVIYQCFGGGGNIPWSAYYNLNLPNVREKFPVFVTLSDCIAPNSADKFMLIFSAGRSAHYALKFSLKDTSGKIISKSAIVDVLVPRSWPRTGSKNGAFLENTNNLGCK